MNYKMRWIVLLVMAVIIFSCKKSDDLYADPYGGGQEVLQISFSNESPTPSTGTAGQEMTFKINGLTSDMENNITFLANNMESEIVNYTDSTITIILPENVSSGGASVKVNGQVFLGPSFSVRGKLQLDPTFTSGVGASGVINTLLPIANNNFIIAGYFDSYQGKDQSSGVKNIAQINSTGNFVGNLAPGYATNGPITSLLRLPTDELLVGGSFSLYDSMRGLNNIAILNNNASLKTMEVELYTDPSVSDPSLGKDTVSSYNGLLFGGVNKLFYANSKITAIGNISQYGKIFYDRSTKDRFLIATSPMRQLVRMDINGNLDSTYNYNMSTEEGLENANGEITDAVMQPDGKLVLVGSFTRFNGSSANRIVRLNEDGSVDGTFKVGSGANDRIYSIRYNAVTQKYIITGAFTTFDGTSSSGLVLLNNDGSKDAAFSSKGFTGGSPTNAMQLNNGLILITGSFETYNNVIRQGLAVLTSSGDLASGYNNTGKFTGIIMDMQETTSGIGAKPAVILVGYINTFEGQKRGNIMKLMFND